VRREEDIRGKRTKGPKEAIKRTKGHKDKPTRGKVD
jgi:hypothetical protein